MRSDKARYKGHGLGVAGRGGTSQEGYRQPVRVFASPVPACAE